MKTLKKQKNITKNIKKERSPSVPYEPYLLEDLKDLEYAAGYLSTALQEGEQIFYLALKNVAKAQGGIKSLSESTNLNRESLYDMLSEKGNPLFNNISKILNSLGIDIHFKIKKKLYPEKNNCLTASE